MLEYLKAYLTEEELLAIKKQFNKDILNNFDVMKDNVAIIIEYLKSIGITDIKRLILSRPDIFFGDVNSLKEKLEKYDINLIKFIFENDPSSLINFEL